MSKNPTRTQLFKDIVSRLRLGMTTKVTEQQLAKELLRRKRPDTGFLLEWRYTVTRDYVGVHCEGEPPIISGNLYDMVFHLNRLYGPRKIEWKTAIGLLVEAANDFYEKNGNVKRLTPREITLPKPPKGPPKTRDDYERVPNRVQRELQADKFEEWFKKGPSVNRARAGLHAAIKNRSGGSS